MSITAYLEREKRADLRAGVLTATVVNMTARKSKRRVKPEDVFPNLRERKPQTAAHHKAMLEGLTLVSGGRVRHVPRAEFEAMKSGVAV